MAHSKDMMMEHCEQLADTETHHHKDGECDSAMGVHCACDMVDTPVKIESKVFNGPKTLKADLRGTIVFAPEIQPDARSFLLKHHRIPDSSPPLFLEFGVFLN